MKSNTKTVIYPSLFKRITLKKMMINTAVTQKKVPMRKKVNKRKKKIFFISFQLSRK